MNKEPETKRNLVYIFEKERLETFTFWPFQKHTKCTAEKMAEAGFIFCGSKSEPDSAQCIICLKKLDGWQAEDDPWLEHKSHSPSCMFVKLKKKETDLTVYNYMDLSLERSKNIMTAEYKEYREDIVKKAKAVEAKLKKLKKKKI